MSTTLEQPTQNATAATATPTKHVSLDFVNGMWSPSYSSHSQLPLTVKDVSILQHTLRVLQRRLSRENYLKAARLRGSVATPAPVAEKVK